jgi:hypothetical protein
MSQPQQTVEPTVTSVAAAAAPLGLAWQMRVGTVFDGLDPAAVKIQLDGDQTGITVNATSMVGQLIGGERVYVIEVPPAGQYVVGRMFGNERWLDAAVVDTTGTLATTSAGTELNVSYFALTVPGWQSGKVYMCEAQLSLSFSVVTDTFAVRIRRDTALTGDLLAEAFISDAGLSTPKLEWPLRPTATERNVRLFLSVIRAAGTGTCAVLGPNLSGGAVVARVWSGIRTADALTTRPGGIWRVT